MKNKHTLKFASATFLLLTLMAFTTMQPGKGQGNDKGNQEQSGDKGKQGSNGKNQPRDNKGNNQVKRDDNSGKDHNNGGNSRQNGQSNTKKNVDNMGRQNKPGQGNGHNQSNADNKHQNDHRSSQGRKDEAGDFEFRHSKRGNGNSSKLNGKRDLGIDWNLNDFTNRFNPGRQKKVTVCHRPNSDNPNSGVTISVSENALQAHLSHGDQRGDCTIDYSDRWSPEYIRSRESVYNVYEQTWERMSFGEALLSLAAQKLLGLRTNLDRNRSTLSADEIRRRELLIYELQNNMNTMDNRLGATRNQLDSDVNIIIQL